MSAKQNKKLIKFITECMSRKEDWRPVLLNKMKNLNKNSSYYKKMSRFLSAHKKMLDDRKLKSDLVE